MRILIIHNRYRQYAGEDAAVDFHLRVMREQGHEVVFYERSNTEIDAYSVPEKIRFLFQDAVWNPRTYQDVQRIIDDFRPQIAHIHNTFLTISPSVYDVLSEHKIPVVQTMHNYRLICPKGVLYRDHHLCELCSLGSYAPSLSKGCWRGSYILNYGMQRILSMHAQRGTFQNKISRYLALTEFSRERLSRFLDRSRIACVPNAVRDERGLQTSGQRSDFALYAGRLSPEKGVMTLVAAWEKDIEVDLRIVGDGILMNPLVDRVRRAGLTAIQVMGRKQPSEVRELMGRAAFLIMPSEWYECFPLTLLESFSMATPVIASRIGAVEEIVQDKVTGLLFEPGDHADLAEKVRWAATYPDEMRAMGERARQEYESSYTDRHYYERLMREYESVLTTGVKQ